MIHASVAARDHLLREQRHRRQQPAADKDEWTIRTGAEAVPSAV
jgi:hypothetical protein